MNSLINGVAADYLSIDDRAIHYGDGLFETILCHNKKLYFWSQHYLRLKRSAEKLKLVCPAEDLLIDDIIRLVNDSDNEQGCVIKIILTRGVSRRGYQFEKNATINRLVTISTIEESYSSILSRQLLSGDLTVCKQQVSINENLAGLKHLNRLENVLARNEWSNAKDSKIIDGLMLNANQYVIECSMSNVFTVKNNQLFTPRLNQSGVQGVMRDVIINIAKENNIEVSISDMRIDDINSMDEMFVTNSLIGMKTINNINDKSFTEHKVTEEIFKTLLNVRESYVQAI